MCIFRNKQPQQAIAPTVDAMPDQKDTLIGKSVQDPTESADLSIGTGSQKKTSEEDDVQTTTGNVGDTLKINPQPTGINTGTIT